MAGKSPYGPSILSVDDGGPDLCYLSPSATQTGDGRPESDGCEMKWFYEYREKRKAPETVAQRVGTQLHAEIERHLLTGARDLDRLALAGLHMVPPPGPDLGVELDMGARYIEALVDPVLRFALDEARGLRAAGDYDGADRLLRPLGLLTLSGVPFVGRIDLVHARGVNQGTDDIESALDPPGTIEVLDWKTTSDIEKWAKTPAQLARSVQMLAYARWLVLEAERLGLTGSAGAALARIRVSHGYFQTKGRAKTRKVSCLLGRDEIIERWEQVAPVARRLHRASRVATVEELEPNLSVCDKFGGCPHRGYCPAGKIKGLRDFFPSAKLTKQESVTKMGFLDKLRNADKAKSSGVDSKVVDAWKMIKSKATAIVEGEPLGYPAVAGAAAVAVGAIDGLGDPTSGFAGTGSLGKATLSSVDEIIGLAEEVAGISAADPTPPPVADPSPPPVAGPDTPKSDAAIASAGPEGKDPTKAPKPSKPKAAKPKDAPTESAPAPSGPTGGIVLIVDAIASCQTTRLEPWIDALLRDLATEGAEALGVPVPDIRSVDAKPFGYGGWKGIVEVAVRDRELPPGAYAVAWRGDELVGIIVRALSSRAALVIRGA